MAINLLEMLGDALGDQVASHASQFLGESETGTKSALGVILPALLGGLAKAGSTEEGAGGLLKTLTGLDIDTGLLSNLAGLFGGADRTSSLITMGSQLVGGLFGDKTESILGTIASLTGLKSPSSSSNLVYMAAPLVFGFLKKWVAEKNLDAGGLMRLLAEQTGFLKGKVDDRLIGALGLTPLLGGASKDRPASSKPALVTTAAAEADEGGSMLGKLLPWVLVLGGLIGAASYLRGCQPGEPTATGPVVTPAPVTAAIPGTAVILPAKVYFDTGSAAIGAEGKATIDNAAARIKAQGVAVDITGYTDKTGDMAVNEELAKQRAKAVRDALLAAGVPDGSINMKPPMAITTTGSGTDAEARRVEISKAN